ncbi:hypothetical protein OF83DRAFT_770230 [Amylostereum chailletii]|nr:hypothetical protein OF83DRAFT_770230 [Amylostereum chailletii]
MKGYNRRQATDSAVASASSSPDLSSASATPSSSDSPTTPTSTPQSSPVNTPTSTPASSNPPSSSSIAQSSSAAASTSASPSPSASASASLPASTSSTASATSSAAAASTTSFTTGVVSTGANGQATTIFVQTVLVSGGDSSGSSSSSSGSSTNTGAIVGGVVGGVAGLAVLLALAFFLWRRNRNKDDFDGNFDPDRVVHHSGHADLDAEIAPTMTPFPFDGSSGASPGAPHDFLARGPQMQQNETNKSFLGPGFAGAGAGAGAAGYGYAGAHRGPSPPQSQYAPTSSDPAEYRSESSHYPPSTAPSNSLYASNPDRGGISPGPSLPATTSSSGPSWQARSAKEREAYAARNAQRSQGGVFSGGDDPGADVLQHQDGGRLPAQGPQEIPPSYDSIPPDQR